MFENSGTLCLFNRSSFCGCFEDQPESQNLRVRLRKYVERKDLTLLGTEDSGREQELMQVLC